MLCGLWVKCGAKVSQNEPVCIGAKLPGNMVLLMLLCMEALLFALFTMCMSCDQFSSVYSNKTYIDHLQARQRGKSFKSSKEKGSLLKNIREVVGDTRYTLMWFLPIKPYWKDWQKMFGYSVPRHRHTTPMRRNAARVDSGVELDIEDGTTALPV
jgi:hypothetical protein